MKYVRRESARARRRIFDTRRNGTKKGLMDEIGFIEEVEEYIKTKYGIEPEICW